MFNRGNDSVSMKTCEPNYEQLAESAKEDVKKIDNVFEAMDNAPYIEIDYKSLNAVIGALYLAKRSANKRFDNAVKQMEKD